MAEKAKIHEARGESCPNCDQKFPSISAVSSLYFIGLMIGSIVTGGLADVWGRRPTLLVSCKVKNL